MCPRSRFHLQGGRCTYRAFCFSDTVPVQPY
nr:MAG TPA: hypothetical protein [Bacteriophage sp.]